MCPDIFWLNRTRLIKFIAFKCGAARAAFVGDVFLVELITARSPDRHSARLCCFWMKTFLFPFQSHPRLTACRRSPSSVVSGGCWFKHVIRPSAARTCLSSLFILWFHSRCFSISLWHHRLLNCNQMLFPGQCCIHKDRHAHTFKIHLHFTVLYC